MGRDQHRAQITAHWLHAEPSEVKRARVVPADRARFRRFLAECRDSDPEVALEATTWWLFVVEEPRGVGAVVHVAELAEASVLRGPTSAPRAMARTASGLFSTGSATYTGGDIGSSLAAVGSSSLRCEMCQLQRSETPACSVASQVP